MQTVIQEQWVSNHSPRCLGGRGGGWLEPRTSGPPLKHKEEKRGCPGLWRINRPKETRIRCTLVQASSVDITAHQQLLGSRCPEARTTPVLRLEGGAEDSKEATLDGESTEEQDWGCLLHKRKSEKREKNAPFLAVTKVSATKALEMNISWAKESCSNTNPGAADLPRHMNHIYMRLTFLEYLMNI